MSDAVSTQQEHGHGRRTAFFKSTPKLSNAFGRPFSTSRRPPPMALNDHDRSQPAPPGILDTLSPPSSPIPSSSSGFSTAKNVKFRTDLLPNRAPVDGEVVSSILNNMYPRPVTGQSSMSPPPSPATKVPFVYRKVSRPARGETSISETIRGSSEDTSSSSNKHSSKSSKSSIRTRTISTKSMASSYEDRSSEAGPSSQGQKGPSSSSLEVNGSASSHRMVGRGGIGSRPRVAVYNDTPASKPITAPNPKLPPQDKPGFVRPSGRGGLGSRPKALAPLPPPPPKPPVMNTRAPMSPHEADKEHPVFIRPSGRGGLASRPKPQGAPSLTLLERLQKRKIKAKKQSKGKEPAQTLAIHPIRPSLSYQITNGSTSTLSTIHFSGETQPPPDFFPEDRSSSSSMRALDLGSFTSIDDGFSLTPPFSATSSTFEGASSVETVPEDDDDDDDECQVVYVEDTRSSTPTNHHQRTLDKLTRTLGEIPPEKYGSFANERYPPDSHVPRLVVDGTEPKREKTSKVFRRSSLSMTALFSRPPERVHDSMSTLTDDLHQLNMDDDLSESWGEADPFRNSYSTSPGSPMMFSPPSPAPINPSRLASSSPDTETESEHQDDDDDSAAPSPTSLSRSHSYTLDSKVARPSRRISHSHSASTSVLDTIALDAGARSPSAASNWIFPPSGNDDNIVTFSLTRNGPDKRQGQAAWTGEWNGDMQDVIRALRTLR